MLRKKKDNSDYEIDRELTWKFAIEKNAEYQEKIEQLEKENDELKRCRSIEIETCNRYREKCEGLEEENKKLREEIEIFYKPRVEELEKDLEHSDSFFSIMRDVLKNNEISNKELVCILCCVVHELCWDYDLSSKELEIVKKFWNRKYV